MTEAAALAAPSLQTIFDDIGRPIAGAKVYYYAAGTTTPLTVFTTAGLSIPHARPVLASAGGRVPPVYVGETFYKARILDAFGTLVEEIDGIQGGVPAPTNPDTPGTGTVVPTGSIRPSFNIDPETDWVRANGRTIGSPLSGALELAEDAAKPLFLRLWTVLPDSIATVSGGRGVSANADWDANKTITLPSLRGRGLRGRDGMGNGSLAGVITTNTFTSVDQLGGTGGTELITLTPTQMPQHNHTASSGAAGGHAHTAASSGGGYHDHTYQDNQTPNTSVILVDSGAPVTVVIPPQIQTTGTTVGNGNHTHTIAVDPVANHAHTVAVDNAGGGGAHNNMPPDMLITFYIKL